ncbi:GNAT family N-acetyltransferase [Trinickia sp. Y13]|uniref:GNAT family N-acetyltransferase n=1 Tax=Trinickia sp. Y13 TaxID=2917807 RepID=UPI002406B02A|nr:GNAT family N-acetyltransferase [Trinickia sp. Y13]MDG0025137.1 GNAT family N-acetyltransferase [Trinickia sp. Y13]
MANGCSPAFDAQCARIESAGSSVRLRAASESDRAFLLAVFESTRAYEFAQSGWDRERISTLLAEQFAMQDAYYRQHYRHARFDVIMSREVAIGRLYHDWHGDEARLIDIALLPAYRGAGIGTRLLHAFVAQAVARAMPIVLYVEMNNPVQALYRRLGFESIGENGVYLKMRRPAAAFEDESGVTIEGLGSSN